MLEITEAITEDDIAAVRTLLREYQERLGIDLCFQDFEAEVEGLPGSYAPPSGRLLIAKHDGMPVGCVALQGRSPSRAEMKRLFVRPDARGLGVGRALVSRVIGDAREIGYEEVVLDTLPVMVEAQRLYEQFGFHDVPPYRANPVPGTRYLAKSLRES